MNGCSVVTKNKRKTLLRLNQKVQGQERIVSPSAFADVVPSAYGPHLTHQKSATWNMVSPLVTPWRKRHASEADEPAGKRCRRKRRLRCNASDRDHQRWRYLNPKGCRLPTRYESRENLGKVLGSELMSAIKFCFRAHAASTPLRCNRS